MIVVIHVDGGNVQNIVADAPGLQAMLVGYSPHFFLHPLARRCPSPK